MRTIRKRSQPESFTRWRVPRMASSREPFMKCTYDELRRDPCLVDVENNLIHEQGGICAYTGIRIELRETDSSTSESRFVDFHIEHLKPQKHCAYGEDAEYGNFVACWPRPNIGFKPSFGACKKGSWPDAKNSSLFVSPLHESCSERFQFNRRGEIACESRDDAAKETIKMLGLNDASLVELRRDAIRGALAPRGEQLTIPQLRRLLAALDQEVSTLEAGGNVRLMEYCFAIRSATHREIQKLEKIRGSLRP